jgi:hypothetical protein
MRAKIIVLGLVVAMAASWACAALPAPRFREVVPAPTFRVRVPLPLFVPRPGPVLLGGQWRSECGPNGCRRVWVPASSVVVGEVSAVVVPAKVAIKPAESAAVQSTVAIQPRRFRPFRFFAVPFWGWPR